MASFWKENQLVWTKKRKLKGKPKCMLGSKVVHFIFHCFFYPCCSNFMKIKDMQWIEDIVKNTLTPPFFTNSRIDMAGFVILTRWLLKVVDF